MAFYVKMVKRGERSRENDLSTMPILIEYILSNSMSRIVSLFLGPGVANNLKPEDGLLFK